MDVRDGAGERGEAKARDKRRKGRRLELSGTQVVGAMLATMTGTLFASKLGVVGTVAGAAVMSVASTVGTAIYQYYLKRGGDRLRDARTIAETASLRQTAHPHQTKSQATIPHGGPRESTPDGQPIQATLPFLDPPATAAQNTPGHHTGDDQTRDDQHALSASRTGDDSRTRDTEPGDDETGGDGQTPDAEREDSSGGGRRRSWKLYAAMAAGVFVLVMGGVTVYEAIVGKPLSSVVNGNDDSGTTLGDLGGGTTSADPPGDGTTTPTPSPNSTTKGGNDDGTTTETTPKPDESTPSDGSTDDSGEPTPAPTGEQTPDPGEDGALGEDSTGDSGNGAPNLEAPDVITTPTPSSALAP